MLRTPRDRIETESWLLVACFASVLLLASQSGASLLTYVLAAIVLYAARDWADIGRSRVFWLVCVTLAYFAASGLWSEPFSWREVFSMAARALLIFCFVVAFAEVQLRGIIQVWLRRGIVAVGTAAILAAIVVFFITDPADGRLNGLGQLDTHVIGALVFGIVVVFGLQVFLRERSAWRWFGGFAILAGAVAVVLSDSRNAWVSVAIGISVLVLAETVKDRQRFIASLASVTVLIGVGALALILNEDTRSLILPRGTSYRPEIWSAALARLAEGNYWVGLGVYTSDDLVIDGIRFQHPHNLYIASLFKAGAIGLVLFLGLIGATLSVLFDHYDEADAKLGLGILGVALPSFMLDGHELLDKIGATWLLFWLPVAIALGLSWSRKLRER